MRPSSRDAILDAAFRLARHDQGALPITFEATAREAGVTKGGVLYHFPTREDLILAVMEYVALRVTEAMQAELGTPFEQAGAHDRVAAYVAVVGRGLLTRADLAVFTEALAAPELGAPWTEIVERWLDLSDVADATTRIRLTAVRLAADGLWMADVTGLFAPLPQDRDAVVRTLLDQVEAAR